MNAPAARAEAKPSPTQRPFYLAMDDVHESAIAKAWAKNTGKSIVFWVPLARLTPEMVIIPVVRDSAERTDMQQEEFDPVQQRKKTVRLKGEDVVSELHECAPVRVADFWQSGTASRAADGFSDMLMGALDRNAFINAVNQSTAIYGVYPKSHHGDDHATLRLGWGA